MSPDQFNFNELFSSPATYAVLGFCSLLIGMAKMGFPGINIIATPILIYLTDVRIALALGLLLLFPCDIVAVINFRKSLNKNVYWHYIPWAMTGVVLAGVVGRFLPKSVLLIIMVIFIFSFAIIMTVQEIKRIRARHGHTETKKPHSAAELIILAIFGGSASMLANASGPLTSLYLLAVGINKKQFIGTGAFLYITYNVIKLVILIFIWKTITWSMFLYSLSVMPWGILGAYLSKWISHLIPERVYRWVIIGFVVISGFSLTRLII